MGDDGVWGGPDDVDLFALDGVVFDEDDFICSVEVFAVDDEGAFEGVAYDAGFYGLVDAEWWGVAEDAEWVFDVGDDEELA